MAKQPDLQLLRSPCVVVGAGVVGLAIAAKLSEKSTVLVLEAHQGFGRETSSRNSEVIHSGVHYPPDSYKTRWCLEGRERLYAFCKTYDVGHARCGKLLVACDSSESDHLDSLADHARAVGARVERWNREKIHQAEPLVRAVDALHFPDTGIVDSHTFMDRLAGLATQNGSVLAFRHRVRGVQRWGNEWLLQVESPEGPLNVQTARVVNAAGLSAAELSNEALGVTRFEHRFCRGRYFQLSGKYQRRFQHLIYPVPQKDGLGVHTTIDLEGQVRLGPDTDWCVHSRVDQLAELYRCDWEALAPQFVAAAQKLVPEVQAADLQPGTVGIRPKLFLDGQAHPDFLVGSDRGWIHCLGIESPGLTASLAIADYVANL